MGYIRKIKKHSHVTFMLAILVYLGNVFCYNSKPIPTRNKFADSTAKKFAGPEACKSCHKAVFDSFGHTAHYFTSRPASETSIKGSFEPGKNLFRYNKWMEVALEKKDGKFLQRGTISGQDYETEPFDIVVGSGRKGQTYLYWKAAKLFQLPVSYFTPLNSWCNSPGYPANYIKFDREIHGQCLECHASSSKIENEGKENEVIDPAGIVYGIDCERCHGPAADHVAYHKGHPDDQKGKYIINAGLLSRQQQLDACAFCHSGLRNQLKPSFSFTVGDKLDDYSVPRYNTDSSTQLDVHGNQYGLLTTSKCFTMSEMNCSSCHNVHNTEFNSPKIFSQRCMNCHTAASHNECKIKPPAGVVLADNCIDCHMPLLPSAKILLGLSGEQTSAPDFVRTHRIAVYLKNTKDYLKKKKGE